MNFADVKEIQIPEGMVKQISCNGTVLWKQPKKELPAEYQEVEYLDSQSKGPWLQTSLSANQNYGFEIKFISYDSFDTSSQIGILFGARAANGGSSFFISSEQRADDATGGSFRFRNGQHYNLGVSYGQIAELSYRNTVFTRNDGTTFIISTPTAFTSANMRIFCMNSNVLRQSYAKIYYLRIYEGNTLKGDFVPCYRKSDNEPGMYDLVTDTFLTNQGSGSFAVGEDVV